MARTCRSSRVAIGLLKKSPSTLEPDSIPQVITPHPSPHVLSSHRTFPVFGSTFDASVIVKTMRLVLQGALSLRGASRACNIVDQCEGGLGLDAPCQTTIQNHIARVGLYLIKQRGSQGVSEKEIATN